MYKPPKSELLEARSSTDIPIPLSIKAIYWILGVFITLGIVTVLLLFGSSYQNNDFDLIFEIVFGLFYAGITILIAYLIFKPIKSRLKSARKNLLFFVILFLGMQYFSDSIDYKNKIDLMIFIIEYLEIILLIKIYVLLQLNSAKEWCCKP